MQSTPRDAVFSAVLALLGLAVNPLIAQPTGGQVVAGTATIAAGSGTLTVTQTSARAIIDWQDFSIAAGELAKFVQPDATSATLNRVVSGLPSSLAGTLEANGRVYLINPNGVLIGAQGRIDTAGFLASTLDVANQDFLAGGDLRFTGGSTAAVRNLGAVNALGGDVFLIARQVENSGTISAANGSTGLTADGTAGLAAGSEVLLTTGGAERLFIQAASVPGSVVNSGTITAASAELKAAGGNAYALAINNSGLVRATGSAVRNGQVWLVASGDGAVISSGTLAASGADGARGGEIRVLGGKVTLAAGALVDVSGAQGGGTALIGGDFQGRNVAVPNARTTLVEAGATIRADATTAGDGGRVIVWADGSTFFGGAISARGGATGGDGGFAEVSGKAFLAYRGLADLRAPFGSTGTLLLDPTDITITGAGTDTAPTFGSFTDGTFDGGANATSTIFIGTGASDTNSTLLKQLATANVVVTTTSAGAGTGNITVNGTISYNSANSLTLTAGNDLTVNNPITNAGAGGLVMNSGAAMSLGASLSSGGAITLNHGGSLTQTAGAVSAATLNLNGLGAVGTGGTPLATSAATIVLNKAAGAGATFVNNPGAVALSGSTGGALTFNSDSGISVNQNLTTAGITTLNADKNNDGTGTLTVANNITLATTNSALNITAADVALVFFGALNSGTAATGITASAGRSIGLGGTAGDLTLTSTELGRITSSSVTLNTTGLTGDVTVNGISFNASPVTINAGGTVTFATAASSFFKGVTVNANDGIAVGADITATHGNIVLDGDANSTVTPGDGIAFTGTRTLTASTDYAVAFDPTQGSIVLRNGTSGANGNITSAAVNLRAADNITIADDFTATGGTFSAIANNPGGADFLNAVTGRFTLASGKTLATATSGNIDIMASKVTLDGNLNSVATASITGSRNTPVNLGSPQTQVVEPNLLILSDAALGRITATGLTIGVETTGLAAIYMKDLTAANTDQFGTLTLTTPGFVGFEGTSVVGNRLTASGSGGIVFYSLANLSTSTAGTSDPDITLSGNNVMFNASVTVTAGGTGTLTLNPTDTFVSNGNLTLESGDHLTLNRALTSYGTFRFNADKNNDGIGTFTVPTGVAVTTTAQFGAQSINITAADVVLTGTATLNSTAGPTNITASAGRSIGLGATVVAGGLNIAGSELQQITATGLTLTSAGNITVDGITEPNSNNISAITTLTANGASSTVTFANTASTFNALTVNSTTTIANTATLTLDVGNLRLNAGTNITQTGAIEIGNFTANLTGATITLAHADNTMGAITVNTGAGDVSIREDSAISIAGITRTSGNLTLIAGGDITQTGAITIGSGTANLTAANITLNQANVLGAVTINAGTGDISLTEADAIAIAGITHTGTLSLTANGAITDSGAIIVSGTTTLAAGAANDITLDSTNDFSTVVVTSGRNVTLNDINALALGNVTAADALLATAAGDLTLNTGATIAATGAVANPLVLVAGGNFINNSGSTALNAGSGRWLVYSTSPAGSTENGLTGSTSPRLYNRTFAGNPPTTIAAGNRLIYSVQPTLTVTADNKTRVYGDANPLFTSTITGFVVDDGVTDTLTTAGLTGAASLTSLAVATSAVLGSPYAITPTAGNLASSAGYAFGFVAGSLTITPASLTLGGTQVYNGTTIFAGGNLTATGVNGETFTVTGAGATGNLTTKNVQTSQALSTITGLTLGTGNSGTAVASNYNAISTTGSSVSVTPASLTLGGTQVYNGTTIFAGGNLTATGVNGETFTVTGAGATGNLTTKNVQTSQALSTITGLTLGTGNSGAAVASNYNAISTTGSSVSVTKASLTVSTTNVVKTYDGNTTAAGTPIITVGTLFSGDILTFGAFGPGFAFVSKDVGIGNKTVTVSGIGINDGNNGLNYTLFLAPNTTSTINPASLTLGGTRVYDGTTIFAGGNLTATGVNGETFTVTGAGATGNLTTKNVQTSQALSTITGLTLGTGNSGAAVASNYNAISTTGSSVSVTPKALTIAGFASNDKIYDGTTAAVIATSGTLTGVVLGDTVGFTNTGATFDTANTGSGKTVTLNGVTLTGSGDQTNYSYTAVTTDLSNITAATLTYTATAANRLYGASNPVFSGIVTGFVNGETQTGSTTGTLAFGSAATVASNVGTYAINGSGLTANNGNYLFTQAAGNATALTVNRAPLTITADNKSKVYGAALPTFTASYSGFVNSDTTSVVSGLTLTPAATAASGVGTSAITPTNGTAANYTITHVPGTLTITPAPLTVTADSKSRAMGVANPALTATYTGFVNNDTSAVVSGLSLATPAVPSSPTGSYPITASGATAPNYTLTFVSGILAVSQSLLTITADNKIKTYGAALPTFTASYAGLINGDTPSVVTGLQFSTTASIGSNVGTYAITPFGGSATNYTLAYVSGLLTINPAALTITASNASRIYGAVNPAFTGSFSGLVNGDTSAVVIGLVFSTPATSVSGVGGYAITPSGAAAANYSLTFVPGTLTINRAPLTLTAANASREFGAANPAFTATFSGFVNNDTAAVVSGLLFNTSATVASAVGEYSIAPLGATAANYTLTFVNGTLRIIAPSVIIDTTPQTVITINQVPVLTPEFAVILLGDRLSLVPVNSPGGVLTAAGGGAGSLDGRLALTLGEATGLPGFGNATAATKGSAVGGAASTNALNLGGFELVTSFAGGSGGGGGINPAQLNEPGLFRESTVNMGGFNVVYHEALAEARQQEESNTALGSSYREFSDADNPQINIVRAKAGRKPADPAAGPNPTD